MTTTVNESGQGVIRFLLLTIAGYLALQAAMVVAHEYAHSTAAWLLGYMPSPLTVIWGNPVTIRGWDEGVPYDRLFPGGHNPSETIIGGIPLLMHAIFVVGGLYLLQRPRATESRPFFYAIYWFVIANLGELVAYIAMRPLAGSGDTGRFNQGLAISPWYLFIAGTAFLAVALGVLLRKVMPGLNVVTRRSRLERSIVVWLTAFIVFLWTSGLRIMALYPDCQWKWGLVGVVAFPGWILADRLQLSRSQSSVMQTPG